MRFFIVIFDINKSLIANLLNAMKNLLPLFVVMALFGCGNKPVKPAWSAGENRHPAYYIYLDPNDTIETVEQVKDNSKSLNDIRFGDWTEEDCAENPLYILQLANKGCAEAQYKMGLYRFEESVNSAEPLLQWTEAIGWWEKAAANGHEEAIKELERVRELQKQTDSVIPFSYQQPINNYDVSGVATKSAVFSSYNIALTFHLINTEQEFTVFGGRVDWDLDKKDSLCLDYPNNKKGDIIESPQYDVPFFFADLDFDGKDELITDLIPHVGQRCVGTFTCIYKIENGQAFDVTEKFTRKSKEIFTCIDPYYFIVNNARKEIILYSDGGAIDFSWRVYRFDNGEYIYDRKISCELNIGTNNYKVTVFFSQGKSKSFIVSEDEFTRDKWNY